MNTKQTNEDQAKSWGYLPDTNTLLQYLNRADLIELKKLTLGTWERKRGGSFNELRVSYKLWEALEFLKSDLGSKLKFAKKFRLNCEVDCRFAEIFVKLLPNVKTLQLVGIAGEFSCCLGEGLAAILKGIESLEHVYFYDINGIVDYHDIKKQYFPKSIKSLKIDYYVDPYYDYDQSFIYDTIDTKYTNLYSLSIFSNRMLKNLSCGMPNLREVEIKAAHSLKISSIAAFLNANPQLVKLITNFTHYDEKILQIILSLKYLEHWSIHYGHWEGVKVYNLPSNYSVKFLKFHGSISAPLRYQLINCCKNIEI